MSRGEKAPAVPLRRSLTYPMVALLATLAAGCGDAQPSADRPSFHTSGTGAPASSGSATASTSPTGSPTTAGPSATATRPQYVFPVQTADVSYHSTHSAYPAADLFAACGAPVVAVTDGVILEVSRVDRFDKRGPKGPLNGGKAVSLLGDDGVRYYGSHLTDVTVGIEAGVRVRAGQKIGTVGKTGNANDICHLHFGISPVCARTGDWWVRRGVIWPAKYLDAWRRKNDTSPARTVADWQHARGCPAAP